MNKLLVICGPTATGKTDLAIKLAKKFSSRGRLASGWNGEIVSADSRQVYIGMDIATGKDLPAGEKFKLRNSLLQFKAKNLRVGYYLFDHIPVWLLDIVRPNQEFTVAMYTDLAWRIIVEVWRRRKLPIIVGGTGFYIKAALEGLETLGMPPDWELRRKLEKKPAQALFIMLAQLDPVKAAALNISDRQNPRRLIRAIEIGQRKMDKGRLTKKGSKKFLGFGRRLSILKIGLTAPPKTLYRRVDERIDEQFRKGSLEEVKTLLAQGYSWDLPAMSAMGYGVWWPYFEKKVTQEEIIKKWKFAEHAYVRRQMTWFRKDPQTKWFDITKKGYEKKVEKLIRKWYTEANGEKNRNFP